MAHSKHPTLKEKVRVYENLLHSLQMHRCVTMDHQAVVKLLDKIDSWSYSHRQGNGEPSDREQQAMIDQAFWNLDRDPLTGK